MHICVRACVHVCVRVQACVREQEAGKGWVGSHGEAVISWLSPHRAGPAN